MPTLASTIVDPAEYDRNAQYETLRNQVIQQELRSKQQAAQSQAEVKDILGKNPLPSLVQQGAGITQPQDTGETDRTPVIQNLYQKSQGLLEQARLVQSKDPKLASSMINDANKLQDTAINLSSQQIAEQKDVVSHIASTYAPVIDQASLDFANQQVEARHKGMVKAAGIPTVYDATTAPKIRQLALSASSAEQQADIALKQIDSMSRARRNEADIGLIEAQAVKDRAEAAKAQANLKDRKTAATAYDQVQKEEQKINEKYDNMAAQRNLAILNDAKKYPTKPIEDPAVSAWDRAKAKVGIIPEPAKLPSKQAQALQNVSNEVEAARRKSLLSLNPRRVVAGMPVMSEGTKPQNPVSKNTTSQFVEGKVYTDANGNKAKWNGSDWEPQ